jgi:hypothetical protein
LPVMTTRFGTWPRARIRGSYRPGGGDVAIVAEGQTLAW